MVERIYTPVEIIAVAAGISAGAGLAVYPVQHHAGFILCLIAALGLILATYLHHTPQKESRS